MVQKYFCDLCGEEIIDGGPPLNLKQDVRPVCISDCCTKCYREIMKRREEALEGVRNWIIDKVKERIGVEVEAKDESDHSQI